MDTNKQTASTSLVISSKLSNFFLRTISGLIIFPPVLFAVFKGGILFYLLLAIAIIIAGYEWGDICGKLSFGIDNMSFIFFMIMAFTAFFMEYYQIAFGIFIFGSYITYLAVKLRLKSENLRNYFPQRRPLFVIGFLYLGIGFLSIAYLRLLDNSALTAIWLLMSVIFNDVFAYIFGSIIQGKKLAPNISPNKTWSGFIAAMIANALFSYVLALYLGSDEIILLVIGIFIAIFAHIGDLLQSRLKRYLQIKDTSNIIPGHGGILDRIDALILVAIYIAVLSLIIGGSPLYLHI